MRVGFGSGIEIDAGAGGGESDCKCRLFRGFTGDGDRELEQNDLSIGLGASSDLIHGLGGGEVREEGEEEKELVEGCCIKQ